MFISFILLFSLVFLTEEASHHVTPQEFQNRLNTLDTTVKSLSRQLMLQQLYVEERIRSEGASGIKAVRHGRDGTKPYYGNTHVGGSVVSIHDHSNYDRTIGMGEFIAVLNGVEFRTRHNDYKLRMADTQSKTYNRLIDVPFPPVPPSVLHKKTLNEQIAEMREYFKAFKYQNHNIRDYRPYFKPVLCYLEGAWTTNTKTLDEPFHSDRHFIDAANWMELQEKIRYTSYTGGKSQFENFSYLPTTIINVTDDGEPIFAQWNYRILCHPIKQTLELKDLKLVDELSSRMGYNRNLTQHAESRRARFTFAPYHGSAYNAEDGYGHWRDGPEMYGLLDRIMAEVPGKDNYPGHHEDHSFGQEHYTLASKGNVKLDTSRYHRWFKVGAPGAMGVRTRHRGFADENLWVAANNQSRVAALSVKDCHRDSHTHKVACHTYTARYSYAIPLEIIWLTPLYEWNPYNFYYHDYAHRNDPTKGGRTGAFDVHKAYNGTSLTKFYKTPIEFFQGGEVGRDPADTARDAVGILDQHGQVKKVVASGTRIFTRNIPGVGKLRMRYPVLPIHAEGSTVWKELVALRDIMMNMNKYSYMFENKPNFGSSASTHNAPATQPPPSTTTLEIQTTHRDPPGMHKHEVSLSQAAMQSLAQHHTVHAFSTTGNMHQHELEIVYNATSHKYLIATCDGKPACWDGHPKELILKHH